MRSIIKLWSKSKDFFEPELRARLSPTLRMN